ncbi:isthmin-2-like isoform X2 [Scleropages formosus]|uniref:isthmin-2-like isoform X2 n=1 Tax=Scleropages formosus TaxID=113540 RepID=UPI0010FAA66E|nr:isthmin-2-like isoform X2 [Scleropages formosus]
MCQARGTASVRSLLLTAVLLGTVTMFPTEKRRKSLALTTGAFLEEQSQMPSRHSIDDLEAIQQLNQVNSVQPAQRRQKRRWSRNRSVGVLPKPEPEEEKKPFILDLKNFPDLANAELNSQNPNIQTEIEIAPAEGGRSDWGGSSVDWLGDRKFFWPLFWSYPDSEEDSTSHPDLDGTTEDYSPEYDGSEELVLSGVGGEWDSRWRKEWDTKELYEDEVQEEWSAWTPCSVTCGQGDQKRTRSCGFACTATESRTCDLEHCSGNVNAVTDLVPYETENGTEVFGAEMDSCEKWLNCKNAFLQKYLQQVLTELPSCPCTYPAEVVYNTVGIFDEQLQIIHRWQDASGPKERLEIYKPTAQACLRSMLSADSTTLAAQHCCYDGHMRLITRGKGAGAPDLISADFSPELHFKVDVLPWILCKGDWTRFHAVRPPNNGLRCAENPREDVFVNELEEAREY